MSEYAKYILVAFGLILGIAIGVYADCRISGDTSEFCRQMVFTPIGQRLQEVLPSFR